MAEECLRNLFNATNQTPLELELRWNQSVYAVPSKRLIKFITQGPIDDEVPEKQDVAWISQNGLLLSIEQNETFCTVCGTCNNDMEIGNEMTLKCNKIPVTIALGTFQHDVIMLACSVCTK
jgi:hypothetical protein